MLIKVRKKQGQNLEKEILSLLLFTREKGHRSITMNQLFCDTPYVFELKHSSAVLLFVRMPAKGDTKVFENNLHRIPPFRSMRTPRCRFASISKRQRTIAAGRAEELETGCRCSWAAVQSPPARGPVSGIRRRICATAPNLILPLSQTTSAVHSVSDWYRQA